MNAGELFLVILKIFEGMLFAMTLLVAGEHLWLWWKDRTRLMPAHIASIALSYDILLIIAMTRPLDWRAYFYVPAIFFGFTGMMLMVRVQKKQRRRHLA